MKLRHLVIAALEIMRKNSNASPVAIEDKINFQQSRKNGNAHLDWACWFLRPLDEMTPGQRQSLYAFYSEPDGWHWDHQRMRDADDALTVFERSLHDDLLRQGERIASRY